jgi:hypothetical protein
MRRGALLLAWCAALLLGTAASPPPTLSASLRHRACDDAYAEALTLLRAGCAHRVARRRFVSACARTLCRARFPARLT